MVTFLFPFLRSFCLFVCFLSHKLRKTFLCALADSCPRSFLCEGLTVEPQPLPAVQGTKTPPASPFTRKELLPSQQVKLWHPLKETWGEEGSRGRSLCAEKLPSDLPARLAEGLSGGSGRYRPAHWALCPPWLLRPYFKYPEERDSHGTYAETYPASTLIHLSFGFGI